MLKFKIYNKTDGYWIESSISVANKMKNLIIENNGGPSLNPDNGWNSPVARFDSSDYEAYVLIDGQYKQIY